MDDVLSAKELARVGLWMLRQAILKQLRETGAMQPSAIRDALGLQSDDSPAPGVAMGVMKLMADSGEIIKGEGLHPTYAAPTTTH
jgi:hypothetical protein